MALRKSEIHCNLREYSERYCNLREYSEIHCNLREYSEIHCNLREYSEIHCNLRETGKTLSHEGTQRQALSTNEHRGNPVVLGDTMKTLYTKE